MHKFIENNYSKGLSQDLDTTADTNMLAQLEHTSILLFAQINHRIRHSPITAYHMGMDMRGPYTGP